MTTFRTLRMTAGGLALAMALVACGQKPGVHVESASAPLSSGQVGTGGGVDEDRKSVV